MKWNCPSEREKAAPGLSRREATALSGWARLGLHGAALNDFFYIHNLKIKISWMKTLRCRRRLPPFSSQLNPLFTIYERAICTPDTCTHYLADDDRNHLNEHDDYIDRHNHEEQQQLDEVIDVLSRPRYANLFTCFSQHLHISLSKYHLFSPILPARQDSRHLYRNINGRTWMWKMGRRWDSTESVLCSVSGERRMTTLEIMFPFKFIHFISHFSLSFQ